MGLNYSKIFLCGLMLSRIFSGEAIKCLACLDPEMADLKHIFMDGRSGRYFGLPEVLKEWPCQQRNYTLIDCDYSCLHIRMLRSTKTTNNVLIGEMYDCSNDIVRSNPNADSRIDYRNFHGNTTFFDIIKDTGYSMDFTFQDSMISFPDPKAEFKIYAFPIITFIGILALILFLIVMKCRKSRKNKKVGHELAQPTQSDIEAQQRNLREYRNRISATGSDPI